MMTIHLFIWILGFYTAVPPVAGEFEAGKVIDHVICKGDPTQSYALYIPAKGNAIALPVIYFFDPHGDGALPVRKYAPLAEAYGFILVGSNNSKNGNDWSVTGNIWRRLLDDTQGRLKIDRNRIYTGGFSGGAKVAGYVALQHPGIKGVIAGGAGLPDGTPAGDFNFSFTALAGEGDMNRSDLVSFSNELDRSRTRHRIIHFDGIHEWAPATSMNLAFAGLQFDAMRQGLLSKDAAFINRYVTQSKTRFDTYYKRQQLIKAEQECKLSISLLDGLTGETAWFTAKTASLAGNTLYRQQRQLQESLLVREQNTKAEYNQHFQQIEDAYWSQTIRDLQTKAGGPARSGMEEKTWTASAERAMYQRLLAYLSLAFYSISNHLINSNDNKDARHFVEWYKTADPANSEAWYFSAILFARDGNSPATEKDLRKAVGCGFRDRERVRQQPEFSGLSPRLNMDRIFGSY
ncbi:MAG TPA: hypothetical protein VL832_06910 [Puia sp.]|nr:hypothetical protein [Puia sp.]